ncbi:TetR/AcrR family transcriptional regulator [Marinomonas agarivorans]|nr:TetR/AcrR family transcriptional regulator [Marinomonas agarivorans]
MAKPQFNQEHILTQASSAFWRFGYHATSMQHVFAATGLKPGSIYLAFGNKEGLFKASLDHYTQQSLLRIRNKLSQSPSVEQGIFDVLMEFVNESCQADYCSCFLVKSQLELGSHPELLQYVSTRLKQIETLYCEFLQQNHPIEEAQIKATSLMLHIFGIRVYGYHSQSKEQILSALESSLPWLPWTKLKH